MRFYLDTSILIHAVLGTNPAAKQWLDTNPGTLLSSRLLQTETIRTLRRDGYPPDTADPLLDQILMLSITDSILARAESIGPHLKTLDAIHLGTLLTIDPGMTLASHDDQLAEVARQLGVATFDPLP